MILLRENISQYKYYFKIGSVESLEEKMEKVQKSLRIVPHDYVPVIYDSEISTFSIHMRALLSPLILLSLLIIKHIGRGPGGSGGKGGSGLFNIGKANITNVNENVKNEARRNILIHSSLLPYHM